MRLRDVVCGPLRSALVSNYMVDLAWLLSACPDLARASRLMLVHGERSSQRCAGRLPFGMLATETADRVFCVPAIVDAVVRAARVLRV